MHATVRGIFGVLACAACGPGLEPVGADGSGSSSGVDVSDGGDTPGVSVTAQGSTVTPQDSTESEGSTIGSTGLVGCVLFGDIHINSQALLSSMAGVCEVEGHVTMAGPNFSELSPMSELTRIGGRLAISSCEEVTSLAPLAGLTTVEGNLSVQHNSMLESFEGLGSIELAGGLILTEADDLTGLAPSIEINGAFEESLSVVALREIAELSSLDQLPALTFTNFDDDDDSVLRVSLSALPLLDSIEPLGAYPLEGGQLWLIDLPSLGSLSGPIPTTLQHLDLGGLAGIADMSGLESVEHVSDLFIYDNPALTSLAGFESLETIGMASIGVCDASLPQSGRPPNPLLTSLTGWDNVRSIDELHIVGQPSLSSIDALDGLEDLGSAVIRNNPSLSANEVESLLLAHGLPIGFDDQTFCGNGGQAPCEPCPQLE